MTEDEARASILGDFGADKLERLGKYVALLLAENQNQNLISAASEPFVWRRHILDSAQLLRFAPDAEPWLDIGSGAGLPGIVLAILSGRRVLLAEPRKRRAAFLQGAIDALALNDVRVRQSNVEKLSSEKYGVVTARAFAPLETIFASTVRLTDLSTIWVLPRGRSADRELAEARQSWQGRFHVEQSLSDDEARIIVATGVKPR